MLLGLALPQSYGPNADFSTCLQFVIYLHLGFPANNPTQFLVFKVFSIATLQLTSVPDTWLYVEIILCKIDVNPFSFIQHYTLLLGADGELSVVSYSLCVTSFTSLTAERAVPPAKVASMLPCGPLGFVCLSPVCSSSCFILKNHVLCDTLMFAFGVSVLVYL